MTYYYVDFDNVKQWLVPYIARVDPKESRIFVYFNQAMNPLKIQYWVDIYNMTLQHKLKYPLTFVSCPHAPESADKVIIADLACDASKDIKRIYRVFSDDTKNDFIYKRIADMTGADIKRHSTSNLSRKNIEEDETQ